MKDPAKAKPHHKETQHKEGNRREKLADERLLDLVQRQSFRYFWDGAQPASGLARERIGQLTDPADDVVATGGSRDAPEEKRIRDRITYLWSEAEWDWYTQGGRSALTWHWSPTNGFALNHPVRGWNERLIAYVLAASSPRYPIAVEVYHEGWAQGRQFLNRRSFEGVELPLGPDWGGPLFFTHYSFCGVDPRGLSDAYADYWKQNVNHTRINYAYCVRNPHGYTGYGPNCWGLTAGDSIKGYDAHSPSNDKSVITPSAALSSFPYAPNEAMAALRNFYDNLGDKIWSRLGFIDGFSEQYNWRADSYLAIGQGPIVVMIENYRSGLIWKLFMGVPEIREGMKRLGFKSPHFASAGS
jgi:hypothetical protein